MPITKIISSGASGAESAALDIAIRLKIPYGGYAMESSMLDSYRATRRYKLWEKEFRSSRSKDEANLHIADATLIFTHGELNRDLWFIDDYAVSHGHPSYHVDFDESDPLQAAFHISIWVDKHSPASLFVTGSKEKEDARIYQATFDSLFSFLMLGKEEYPEQVEPAPEKKPLPKTVEAAVEHLIEVLPLKDKVTIANMSADGIEELNLSLGNYIRNSFGLWSGNEELIWSCAKEAGRKILHEDEASAIIIARLALELERTHKLRTI
jgi:hypothetical protein